MTPLLAAGDIGAETVPGSVQFPTWLIAVAIVALYVDARLERRAFLARIEAGSKILNDLTTAVDKLADRSKS